MIRFPRRPSQPAAALALTALCLLGLSACGQGRQQPGLVLEPSTAAPEPATVSPGPVPEPGTCFEIAGAYTALTLVPLSTDDSDPHFHPEETAVSVAELGPGLPAELRPAFDDAVAELRAAGGSVQPAELADLQRTLAPVRQWLQWHCSEPTPAG